MQHTRRQFLTDVGRGMLIAGVGSGLARDLGFGEVRADETDKSLSFGRLEPLVDLMQETSAERLLPLLVGRLQNGMPLSELVSAAALANARTFGGEDYVGFHTMMALAPAYHMALQMPHERQPLPVLKVLHRNTRRLQEKGGRKDEVLHVVRPAGPAGGANGQILQAQVRRKDLAGAERTFAALAQGPALQAFDELLYVIEDGPEVHRVVMAYRAWELVGLVGEAQAHTLLRQSVHYGVHNEPHSDYFAEARRVLPKLLEQYRLGAGPGGSRQPDDAWVEHLSRTLFAATPVQAAEAAAAALAEGMAPDAVGEAITLAANQLVLRDEGRPPAQASAGKPPGSVHGDGIGVHACDSANAWRNIARVVTGRHRAACLVLAAYQVARDRSARGGDFLTWEPYPRKSARERLTEDDPRRLLAETEAAVRANDQARASAAVERYGRLGHAPEPVFDLLLRYAVSEDGALHAEKYYHTASEEFARTRAPFRWRQAVALARVTASEFGRPAPGYAESCRLLGVVSS